MATTGSTGQTTTISEDFLKDDIRQPVIDKIDEIKSEIKLTPRKDTVYAHLKTIEGYLKDMPDENGLNAKLDQLEAHLSSSILSGSTSGNSSTISLSTLEANLKDINDSSSDIKSMFESTSGYSESIYGVIDEIKRDVSSISSFLRSSTSSSGLSSSSVDLTSVVNKLDEISANSKNISTNTDSLVNRIGAAIVDSLSRPISGGTIAGNSSNNTISIIDMLSEITGRNVSISGATMDVNSIMNGTNSILDAILGETAKIYLYMSNEGNFKRLRKDNKDKKIQEEILKAQMNAVKAIANYTGLTKDEKDAIVNGKLKQQKDQEEIEKRLNKKKNRKGKIEDALEKTTDVLMGKTKGSDFVSGALTGAAKLIPHVGGIVASVVSGVINMVFQNGKLQSEYLRSVGGGMATKSELNEITSSFIKTQVGFGKGRTFNGYNPEEIFKALKETAESLGRATTKLTNENIASAINLNRMGISGAAINQFDTFGMSLKETDKYFAEAYGSVSKKGLSFSNVTKNITDGLRIAQSYTFENGLRGLEKMAEKSAQLKFNMSDAASFADKVNNFEGAIKVGAQLTALGGRFAALGNPMQLLYEGINDMEALTDRMTSMFDEQAYFDTKKGHIDLTASGRLMAKYAAQAVGISSESAINMAMTQAKNKIVESQLNKNGRVKDRDVIEYIKNLSQLDKKGNAYIRDSNGDVKYVKDLTDNDKAYLKKESERKDITENANLGNIYTSTMGIEEQLKNIFSVLSTKIFGIIGKIALKIGAEVSSTKEQRDYIDHIKGTGQKPWEQFGISEKAYFNEVRLGMHEEDVQKFADKKNSAIKKRSENSNVASNSRSHSYSSSSIKSTSKANPYNRTQSENGLISRANRSYASSVAPMKTEVAVIDQGKKDYNFNVNGSVELHGNGESARVGIHEILKDSQKSRDLFFAMFNNLTNSEKQYIAQDITKNTNGVKTSKSSSYDRISNNTAIRNS